MTEPEPCRDLASINVALARLDERQKGATERRAEDAIEIQRRLHDLNGSHEMLLREQAKMTAEFLRLTAFDQYKIANDERFYAAKIKTEEELRHMDIALSNLLGKLWLPLIAAGAVAAGLTAAAMKFLIH